MGDTNLAACSTLQAFVPACNVLTPGFTTITNTLSQAECFCYNKGAWNPNLYDGYYGSCVNYYLTASPIVLESIADSNGGVIPTAPCSALGDFKPTVWVQKDATFNLDPQPTTTPPGLLACASVDAHFASCYSKTPGFSTLTDANSIAACLCYSDKVWQPEAYDSPWTSCAYYLSTADPAAYTTFVGSSDPHVQTQPCRALGDILSPSPAAGPSSPGPSPSSTKPPSPDPTTPGPATSEVSSSSQKPGSGTTTPIPSSYASTSSLRPSSSIPSPPPVPSNSKISPKASSSPQPDTPTITPGPIIPSFLGGTSITQPGISPTILSNTNNPITDPSCASIQALKGSCLIRSPGLATISDFRTAASCLCYSGVVWQPTKYDSVWGECATYLSTAFPGEYSVAAKPNSVSFLAPCSFVGDVLAGGGSQTGINVGSSNVIGGQSSSATPTRSANSGATALGGKIIFKAENCRFLMSIIFSYIVLRTLF